MRTLAAILTFTLFAGPQDAGVRRWRADLDAFARHYSTEHPAPFRSLPETEFKARLEALKRSLPALKDHQIAARWAMLVADLGDEHTEVDFDAEFGARRLPIEIESYPDGAFITGVSASFRQLLGARLERVEGVPMKVLYATLKPYFSFRQEGWYRHLFEESFGRWPLLMDAAGGVKVKERWTLQGTLPGGQAYSVQVPLILGSQKLAWNWEARGGAPLRFHQPGASFFFRVTGQEQVLYLCLRECHDTRRRRFGTFLNQAMHVFRERHLSRMVVDLRGNTGGSEALVNRLVDALGKEPSLNVHGHLLALTDGAVFSAAAVAAWKLRHLDGAILVGEPCGAGPNHVGAVVDIGLPSGRIASFGTEVHIIDEKHPDEFAAPIVPDHEIHLTHSDLVSGRDPVLDAALR